MLYSLEITVVGATGLPSGTMLDPNSRVSIACGGQDHQTSVKFNTTEPIWNEVFQFTDIQEKSTLEVRLLDAGVVSDDVIGETQLSLTSIVGTLSLNGSKEVILPMGSKTCKLAILINYKRDPAKTDSVTRKSSSINTANHTAAPSPKYTPTASPPPELNPNVNPPPTNSVFDTIKSFYTPMIPDSSQTVPAEPVQVQSPLSPPVKDEYVPSQYAYPSNRYFPEPKRQQRYFAVINPKLSYLMELEEYQRRLIEIEEDKTKSEFVSRETQRLADLLNLHMMRLEAIKLEAQRETPKLKSVYLQTKQQEQQYYRNHRSERDKKHNQDIHSGHKHKHLQMTPHHEDHQHHHERQHHQNDRHHREKYQNDDKYRDKYYYENQQSVTSKARYSSDEVNDKYGGRSHHSIRSKHSNRDIEYDGYDQEISQHYNEHKSHRKIYQNSLSASPIKSPVESLGPPPRMMILRYPVFEDSSKFPQPENSIKRYKEDKQNQMYIRQTASEESSPIVFGNTGNQEVLIENRSLPPHGNHSNEIIQSHLGRRKSSVEKVEKQTYTEIPKSTEKQDLHSYQHYSKYNEITPRNYDITTNDVQNGSLIINESRIVNENLHTGPIITSQQTFKEITPRMKQQILEASIDSNPPELSVDEISAIRREMNAIDKYRSPSRQEVNDPTEHDVPRQLLVESADALIVEQSLMKELQIRRSLSNLDAIAIQREVLTNSQPTSARGSEKGERRASSIKNSPAIRPQLLDPSMQEQPKLRLTLNQAEAAAIEQEILALQYQHNEEGLGRRQYSTDTNISLRDMTPRTRQAMLSNEDDDPFMTQATHHELTHNNMNAKVDSAPHSKRGSVQMDSHLITTSAQQIISNPSDREIIKVNSTLMEDIPFGVMATNNIIRSSSQSSSQKKAMTNEVTEIKKWKGKEPLDSNIDQPQPSSSRSSSNIVKLNIDGNIYEGEVKGRRPHGKGTYTNIKTGHNYSGQWNEGRRQGYGCEDFGEGEVYEGEWKDDRMNGFGTYSFQDGNVYKGEFYDGKHHGKGLMIYTNGSQYDGDWKQGKPHGEGIVKTVKSSYRVVYDEGKLVSRTPIKK